MNLNDSYDNGTVLKELFLYKFCLVLWDTKSTYEFVYYIYIYIRHVNYLVQVKIDFIYLKVCFLIFFNGCESGRFLSTLVGKFDHGSRPSSTKILNNSFGGGPDFKKHSIQSVLFYLAVDPETHISFLLSNSWIFISCSCRCSGHLWYLLLLLWEYQSYSLSNLFWIKN